MVLILANLRLLWFCYRVVIETSGRTSVPNSKLSTPPGTNRNHYNINWYNTASCNKSSLNNYFKKQPYLECYLLDKEDFYGVSLKFKARSNDLTRHLPWSNTLHHNSRTSPWAGSQTDGLCNLCNNASEDIEHFMLSCNATDDLRMDEFHKLEQRLIETGLQAAWNLFNTHTVAGATSFLHRYFRKRCQMPRKTCCFKWDL